MFSVFDALERGLSLLQAAGLRFFVGEAAFAEMPGVVGAASEADGSGAERCRSWLASDFAPTA